MYILFWIKKILLLFTKHFAEVISGTILEIISETTMRTLSEPILIQFFKIKYICIVFVVLNKKNVCCYLPSIPMRISSTHGNIRIISKLGNGMWRKKPMRISKPSSLQMSRIVLAAKRPFIYYVSTCGGVVLKKKWNTFLKLVFYLLNWYFSMQKNH